MKNPIVGLIERSLARFKKFHAAYPQFFPEQNNLYPIPFFGDIRKAEVLTLALNPAWTEFRQGSRHERHWVPGLDACALATRLLYYFDLPTPPPHRWFKDRREALATLGCSYEVNAAHIDLHPLPTKFRKDLTEPQRNTIGGLIETHSASHLAALLQLAPKAKSVLVVDYTFSKSDGTTAKTSDFISTHQPIAELLQLTGNRLRVYFAGETNQFEARIAECRDTLRKHLRATNP